MAIFGKSIFYLACFSCDLILIEHRNKHMVTFVLTIGTHCNSLTSDRHFDSSKKKKTREKVRHAENILPVRSFPHVTDVTSGQKTPLGRILRNFLLRMHITDFR